MQAILKPVTRPELGEIIIRDALFAIGRHEAPFSGYDAAVVAKMSRRHARIFEQDGSVYVADLGSLNGTSVNGRSLENLPVALQRGDRVCFTDELCYDIELLGASSRQASEPTSRPSLQLVLVPERQKLILEPIAVTRFPFLISKASDVFSRYRDPLPEEVAYLSRRHAHLFLNGDDLYIEDLGSTNGTFVGGERLEEHARQLHDGDLIAFGGDNFVYRVQLVYPDRPPQTPQQDEASKLLTATARGAEDVTRTTFVTSANSFLDIYCLDDDSGGDAPEAAHGAADGDGEDSSRPAGGRWQRLLVQPATLLRELRSDVPHQRRAARRRYWLAALLVMLAAALWAWLDTAPRRDIRALLDNGDYRAAALRSGRYVAQHPDDDEMRALAVESLLKAVVPQWQSELQDGDFDAAARSLAQAAPLAGDDERRQLLDTLQWVTRMERFVAGRGGADAPVVMFRDETPMRELLHWWDEDPARARRELSAIAQEVPAFLGLRAQVFSHVRSLDSQRSLSLAALDRLLEQVRAQLDAGDVAAVHALLGEFEAKYPRIDGVDSLRADLDDYERIDADVRARRWIDARRQVAETRFRTPVFRERVNALTRESLPPTDLVRRYAEADGYWREGDSDAALAALEQLAGERWGEDAERRLAHDRKVLADYRQLQDSRGRDGYETRLLAFFQGLDRQRDSWYAGAIADDLKTYRDKAVTQVRDDYDAAGRAWRRYRDAGGIGALQRLEAGVSATYRQQAQLLGEAWRYARRAHDLQALLDAPGAPADDQLYGKIVNEVKLQRQSLLELAMVLEPSLKQAKLDLLPVIKADEP